MSVHRDAGRDRQVSSGEGIIKWIAVVLGYYNSGVVGTINFIVKRLTRRTGKSNFFSFFEYGCNSGILCDGESIGVVGASIAPTDKLVSAFRGGGEGGGGGGARGGGGDGGGAHGVVSGAGRHSVGVGTARLDIGEVAPVSGGLIVGKGDTRDVDGDIGGNIFERVVVNRWRHGGLAFNRGEAGTARESRTSNSGHRVGNGHRCQTAAVLERRASYGGYRVGNNCILATQ